MQSMRSSMRYILRYRTNLKRCGLQHSQMRSLSAATAVRVSYLTDLEGDYPHWRKYLNHSEVFETKSDQIFLKDNCHFVFGGDICDRNNGDLRLLKDFLTLKRRYPDRVHFILGNRDINKLRLLFSLQQRMLDSLYPPLVYWLHGSPALLAQATQEVQRGDATSKLRWILGRTMGAPQAFQHRQQELRDLGLAAEDTDVTASFLHSLTPHEGLLWEYLSHGKIALILGDTLFVHGAIHDHNMGWIPPMKAEYSNDLSLTPPRLLSERRVADVRAWVGEINAFAQRELADYTRHALAFLDHHQNKHAYTPSEVLWEVDGGYGNAQPGSRLIQYGMGGLPARQLNNTVIYSSYLHAGKARYSSELVGHWLAGQGIARVIVGHQPNGDSPWILNSHSIQTISADAAYSKNVLWPLTHFEGHNTTATSSPHPSEGGEYVSFVNYCAKSQRLTYRPATSYAERHSTRSPLSHSEIVLHLSEGVQAGNRSDVSITGALSDGSTYSFTMTRNGADDFVGMKTKGDWFVKAANVRRSVGSDSDRGSEGKKWFLLSKTGESFQFMNRLVDTQQLIRELYD